MNYREAYLTMPLMITATGGPNATTQAFQDAAGAYLYFNPQTATSSADFGIGLKNWYGSIIHSFTLDYNGTTIIQQTPYIGLWNTFKLNTTLSYNDLIASSAQLGFWPDTAGSVGYCSGTSNAASAGTYNNVNGFSPILVSGAANSLGQGYNNGLLQRQLAWNYDPNTSSGTAGIFNTLTSANPILPTASLNQLWKSYIYTQVNQPNTGTASPTGQGVFQVAITASVYLKHIASFFERVPLLKGVFMKMTLNLNQTSVSFTSTAVNAASMTAFTITNALNTAEALLSTITFGAGLAQTLKPGQYFQATLNAVNTTCVVLEPANPGEWIVSLNPVPAVVGPYVIGTATSVNTPEKPFYYSAANVVSPLGGVNPLMLASMSQAQYAGQFDSGASSCFPQGNYLVSLNVGSKCLNTTQANIANVAPSPLSGSIILNIPAYSFNPVFESSYLSSPIKKIVYTDVYQYQIVNTIKPQQNFNNLISNGIANIKSVLCLPFFSASQSATYLPANVSVVPIQSPFDPAGGGPTSPGCLFSQFNIQISGQNAIYNTERYSYEQYLNQLYGVNAVNGGQTDGMTSGLIDQKAFESCYNYYYVDCGRMLPVEEAVPKSINVLGLSQSALAVDLFIFVEYGVEVSLDILTGARV